MSDVNLSDLRAIETILEAVGPLETRDQVRVLTWVIEKLDLGLDMKLALANARSKYRNYIELAWESVPEAMGHPSEFVAAAAPDTLADRVLVIATFLQMKKEDPDTETLTGKEINSALRSMGLAVNNVADCIYTLIRRTPPHMVEAGRAPNRRTWKGYRVTETGIEYVYERIAKYSATSERSRATRK